MNLADKLDVIAKRSFITDKQLTELLPTLSLEDRIETIICKYVGGGMDVAYDGDMSAARSSAHLARYLLHKMRPWLPLAVMDHREAARLRAALQRARHALDESRRTLGGRDKDHPVVDHIVGALREIDVELSASAQEKGK